MGRKHEIRAEIRDVTTSRERGISGMVSPRATPPHKQLGSTAN